MMKSDQAAVWPRSKLVTCSCLWGLLSGVLESWQHKGILNQYLEWGGTVSIKNLFIVGLLNVVTGQGMDFSNTVRISSLTSELQAQTYGWRIKTAACKRWVISKLWSARPAFTQQQGSSDILEACCYKGRPQYLGKITQRLSCPLLYS